MPLELGVALGMRYLKEGTPAGHNGVALVPEQFVHQKSLRTWPGSIRPITIRSPRR